MAKKPVLRQGDVALNSLTEDEFLQRSKTHKLLSKKEPAGIPLAYGEGHGHVHCLVPATCEIIDKEISDLRSRLKDMVDSDVVEFLTQHIKYLEDNRVDTPNAAIEVVGEPDQDQFIKVSNGAAFLKHSNQYSGDLAEHAAHILPSGFYEKIQEIEVDPYTQEIHRVVD